MIAVSSPYAPPPKTTIHRVKRKPLPALLAPATDLQRLPLLHIEWDLESNPTFSSVLQFPLPPPKVVDVPDPGDDAAAPREPAMSEPYQISPTEDMAAYHIWSAYSEPGTPALSSPTSTSSHSPSNSLSSLATMTSRETFDSLAPTSPSSSLSSLATTIDSEASSAGSKQGLAASKASSPSARPTRLWHRGKMLFITPTSAKDHRRAESCPEALEEDVLEIVARR